MTTYAPHRTTPRRSEDDDDQGHRPSPLKRKREPRWAKLCLIIGAVLMMVSGVAVAGSKALGAWLNDSVKQEDLLPDEVQGKTIDGAINILLLGMDERKNSTDLIRTDSIILAHIPATHDAVYLVSLPRDTMVQVPPFPEYNFTGAQMKLTEAFPIGNSKNGGPDPSTAGRKRGVTVMAKTISTLVPGGIKFNAVAIINYDGFKKLVTALGGVKMCIDQTVVSEHYDQNGKYVTSTRALGIQGYTYKPACRVLKPWEALDYVRQREDLPHGDYDRQRHQQQFLKAVFAKLLSKGTLTDPTKFNALKDAAGDLLTMDLGKVPLIDWIFSFKSLNAKDVVTIQTNKGDYNGKNIGGKSYQFLSDDSIAMLKALHDDTLIDFLGAHPDFIAKDK
jgi:polyisoprenyl-teichoic acid--peptidoglycan teichoic acid transferase